MMLQKCCPDQKQAQVVAYPELDKLLAFDIGGDQHLVNHAALALAQTAAHISLGEALCLTGGLVRQGCRLTNDDILP